MGAAFNLTTGIFTAPLHGIYHFDFSCIKEDWSIYINVFIQLNGETIGTASTNSLNNKAFTTASLTTSLQLKEGDKINLYKEGGSIMDGDSIHYTHFAGWLVEEYVAIP